MVWTKRMLWFSCLICITLLFSGCGLIKDKISKFPFPKPPVDGADGIYGADANPTGEPIGGGEGYSKLVLSGDYTVSTKEQFLAALSAAKSGQVIYIDPQAQINLTGQISIEIPPGVTIAGNRGHNGSLGPLIYTDTVKTYPDLLRIRGTGGVRITGIRLRGASPDTGEANGINILAPNVEVDNCEIYNWTNSAIHIKDATEAYIHHNYIHDVNRAGWGYLVCFNTATGVIEANIFDNYGNAIAATGTAGTGYEARYNLVRANGASHAFDMHGGSDFCPGRPASNPCTQQEWQMAGKHINIHHNTFLITNYEAIVIDGVPTESVNVNHNWFINTDQSKSVLYKYYRGGNAHVYMNVFGNSKTLVETQIIPGPIEKLGPDEDPGEDPGEDPSDIYGAGANPTGEPLGGGVGYSKLVLSGDYTVSNKDQFLAALSAAKPGQVIYIEPTAQINLTGHISILIPSGITIAGNRGHNGSPGPLIYTNTVRTYPDLLRIRGTGGVRITGIRLRGGSPDTDQANGINILAPNVEVDNCEIYNWTDSGIHIKDTYGAYIHHNYIHDVRRPGAGYPVCFNAATGLVEANVFDYYRHAIAGAGTYGTGYEARYNLVKGNAISHAFDMHGGSDNCPKANFNCTTDQDWIMAGKYLNIHHNTFWITSYEAIVIRGIPTDTVRVHSNWFINTNKSKSVFYKYYRGGDAYVYMNIFGNSKTLVESQITPGPITKI